MAKDRKALEQEMMRLVIEPAAVALPKQRALIAKIIAAAPSEALEKILAEEAQQKA